MNTRTEQSPTTKPDQNQSFRPRFITAASLFDGHDASINIMRRILQQKGAEVIHLGHNRSVDSIVEAAIEEDAHAIAISSYQGGHVEFFSYMVDLLAERNASHIRIFGGGGGTITDQEASELHAKGVERIYSVEDGRGMGLEGMIEDMLARTSAPLVTEDTPFPSSIAASNPNEVARAITLIEELHGSQSGRLPEIRAELKDRIGKKRAPVLGITGTGGAGKSSLTDELVRRLRLNYPDRKVAILSVDPSRRRTGGALLGDRIRMNAVQGESVFMRSMATRRAHLAVAGAVQDSLQVLCASNYDLVILETAGIGQSDSEVVDLCDFSLYVMTPEFGAPSQLEKIDMLDFADCVAINKSDKRGADDALRDVRKQFQRNRGLFDLPPEQMPVYLTSASRFADSGVDQLFSHLASHLKEHSDKEWEQPALSSASADIPCVVPPERNRYLSDVAESLRHHRRTSERQSDLASRADGLARALRELGDTPPPVNESYSKDALVEPEVDSSILLLRQRYQEVLSEIEPNLRNSLANWKVTRKAYDSDEFRYEVRGKEICVPTKHLSLSGTSIPKVALPKTKDWGDLSRWMYMENLPGHFPYTAGVFPFKRTGEDPARMFAGEGTPERTNRRFHLLSKGQPTARLSTAFDSVTLYGQDPANRPDIYGKIGNSGVSVCSLDDAKRLYSGFDLCSSKTSVSMTINGPAPMMLAFFLNTAIDQAVEKRLRETNRWDEAQTKIKELCKGEQPIYRSPLPEGHDGSGLGLLGVTGDQILPKEEYQEIRKAVLSTVRGTVQADILKEDQAQNTCIFSTEFALKMMGDVQEWFIQNDVRNFYSVSISGYHIAEAGANPLSQLAFTLANGFTFVEYYKSRGMNIDDFAPNLSFFFSNGLDAEYSVIGRVARRIWAVAMRDLYEADERSQKLKYHIQTSGRSLHAQEIAFNDIRTTLQALLAINDNCQSLHTNAYDEAITTPTEESVRRALAIQLIINKEFGEAKNENPLQGAFLTDLLTDLVEEAVLDEFDRLSERGGVLGAMETMYQRGKIQEESLHYETLKHSGELPIVGVNTFLSPGAKEGGVVETELIRSTDEEKQCQVQQVQDLENTMKDKNASALEKLRSIALRGENIFDELMDTVHVASLGQISQTLNEVGGEYRRSM
ncbi:MAG: methylmalonyl-CoA mutase family protein [Planctomycetota bacterium]|nr:methylmalonyl-CoA mutase family protein [Planctomycetota bacterium]|tara:strand:- start:2162 stop:5608 length:3447 start_codon:yes stop_codon:yes gene_type:complete